MTNISFQYPAWFLILCLLLGLAYAMILYFRDNTFQEQSKRLNGILGFVRFLSVSLISMLLLSPIIRSVQTQTQKPLVILAQDQSESILANVTDADSASYVQEILAIKKSLSDKYEVKEYAFGSKVREGIDFQFQDKTSNISDVLNTVYDLYSNQNLGAVVVATDGIYNEGSNPIYAGTKLNVPIYTIALGDTTPKRDLVLKRVFHNKIAYLGDRFSIQVDVTAQNSAGANTRLTVSKVATNGSLKKIQEVPLQINANDYFHTEEFILDADQSGVQRYRISVNGISDEVTRANNTKDIFIDVLDARQKILLLAHSPHPDLTTLKQVISSNKNYQIKINYASEITENVADYDFVILHQLPSSTYPISPLLKVMDDKRIPRLFIVGSQSNIVEFNKAQSLLSISGAINNTNEVQSHVAPNFNLFTIDERIPGEVAKFPPVISPFGEFRASPKSQVLLYQKIGSVDTKYPLLLFGEERNIKTAVFAAEGLWKWRLFDFLQHKNYEIFDELMGKTFQYVTLKEDKRKFRVSVSKNIFDENEGIYFDAELYNQSYELINDPDASLTITDATGKEFNFTFNKTEKAYTLNAGYFPVGNYNFMGKVNVDGQQLTYPGKFSVQPIQLEIFETTADHNLLRLLGEKYDGDMLYPDNLATLGDLLAEKDTMKPRLYDTLSTRNLVNLKWIFFLLLGLLTLEWVVRRYFGAY